jgi:hypothetical protein
MYAQVLTLHYDAVETSQSKAPLRSFLSCAFEVKKIAAVTRAFIMRNKSCSLEKLLGSGLLRTCAD